MGRAGTLRIIVSGLLALGCVVQAACGEGTLEAVRRKVREDDGKQEEREHSGHHSHGHDHCDDEGGLFVSIVGPAVFFTVASPWWLPHFALGDDFACPSDFVPAPYAQGHPGLLVTAPPLPEVVTGVSTRLSTEYGTDFDDLSRIGTRLVLDTSSRLGFDAEWNHWIEQVPAGGGGGGGGGAGRGRDHLDTGDFNLVFRFAQHQRMQFHSGVGFNWLADSGAADFGFNFTYGLDIFPRDPWVFSATMDWGTLGETSRFHVRTSVGVTLRGWELFTGYDYHRFSGLNMHGLLAGVRLWF